MNSLLAGPMIIRKDAMGDGRYQASRGDHRHEGVDYVVTPGEHLYMPFDGIIVREARPYIDGSLSGCVIQGASYCLKIFYMMPYASLIGSEIQVDTQIGTAQDVRVRYGSKMVAHIHVQVEHMDSSWLFKI